MDDNLDTELEQEEEELEVELLDDEEPGVRVAKMESQGGVGGQERHLKMSTSPIWDLSYTEVFWSKSTK